MGDAKPLRRYGRPLTPLEHEAWSSPLLPVPKKDGTSRICVDYRALNKLTKSNAYPLPRIEECYRNLAGAKYFTCLDLRSGYCRYGHFQFRVMPFGLTNAPATFQRMMNEILRDFVDQCAMVYLDDVIIFSKTKEEHIKNVLDIVRELNTVSRSHCIWRRSTPKSGQS